MLTHTVLFLQKCLNWSTWLCQVALDSSSPRSRPPHPTQTRLPAFRQLCGQEMQRQPPRAAWYPWISGVMPWRRSLLAAEVQPAVVFPMPRIRYWEPLVRHVPHHRTCWRDRMPRWASRSRLAEPHPLWRVCDPGFCPLPSHRRQLAPEILVWADTEVAAPTTIQPPRQQQQQATVATTWTPTTQQQQLQQQQLARIISPPISPKIPLFLRILAIKVHSLWF